MSSTDAQSPRSPTDPKERFYRHFQHEATALQERFQQLADIPTSGGERADAIDHCLATISRLSNEVKDASFYIPSYDQRTYAEAIKALSDKLQSIRTALAPKPKFAFKTVRKNPSAISLDDAAQLAEQTRLKAPGHSLPSSTATSSVAPTPEGRRSPTQTAERSIADRTDVQITLSETSSDGSATKSLLNLSRCVVDISAPSFQQQPYTSLSLRDVTTCLLVCGQVTGPIHVTNLQSCIVLAACQQLRLHDCKDVDLYLYCRSRPIIEDCQGMKFAPLPGVFSLAPSFSGPNQWDQVDDFKWLKSEPSPHWRITPQDQCLEDNFWTDLVSGGPKSSAEERLRSVGLLK